MNPMVEITLASNASVATEAIFTSPTSRPVCENLLVGEPPQTRRFGPTWPEAARNKKEAGRRPQRPAPRQSFLHQRRQLHEHIGHPAPELFIVPLEPGDLLRVHAEGIGMDGHLIEIVGAPPL